MPSTMHSSSSDDDVERGPKSSYEELDEEPAVKKTTGLQRFLDNPVVNTVVVAAVIVHVFWVIIVVTFSDNAADTWLMRLGYVSLFLLFLQVVEVIVRVFAFLRQILCRLGDILDFFVVAISFGCLLWASADAFPTDSSDSGSSDSGSDDDCPSTNSFLAFSAILYLRLWRFGRIIYQVRKEKEVREAKERDNGSELLKINHPMNKPKSPRGARLFDSDSTTTAVTKGDKSRRKSSSSSSDDDMEAAYRERERKLEMDKSVLAAELRLANEQIAKLKANISDTCLKEGLPATAHQLSRSATYSNSNSTPSLSTSAPSSAFSSSSTTPSPPASMTLPQSTSSPSLAGSEKKVRRKKSKSISGERL